MLNLIIALHFKHFSFVFFIVHINNKVIVREKNNKGGKSQKEEEEEMGMRSCGGGKMSKMTWQSDNKMKMV